MRYRDISTYTGATEMRCRLDKNDGYNSMGSSFTNLARLMENNAIRFENKSRGPGYLTVHDSPGILARGHQVIVFGGFFFKEKSC